MAYPCDAKNSYSTLLSLINRAVIIIASSQEGHEKN